MKIINGNILIISPGTIKLVSIRGVKKLTFIFLKNSISSNKFNKIPKQ